MIFHLSTTIEEFQWRRPTGRPHNESQVLCCGLLRKWPHFRQSYGDARRKRRDSLFQNKISKLFNSTSIADFSTPNKSWKEGQCVGTIRKMLEIENPVWDFQECLKFSGRLECVCCVVDARMQMQFWRAHIKRVQMPLKQLFNGA